MPYGEGYVSIGNVIGASAETGSFGGYNVADYGFGGSQYNSLTAYYGYGYNSYISGVAGTSPFFASFSASTGYGGGPAGLDTDLSGSDITGSFASISDIGGFFGISGPVFPAASAGFGDISGAARSDLWSSSVNFGNNLENIYNFFSDLIGATPQGAAAATGVLSHESAGGEPNIFGGYQKRALGIDQWLPPRRDQLYEWAESEGLPPWSLEAQEGFLSQELMDPLNSRVLNALITPGLSQSSVATTYTNLFVIPHRGRETTLDIEFGQSWQPMGRTGVGPGPLFTIINPPPFYDVEW